MVANQAFSDSDTLAKTNPSHRKVLFSMKRRPTRIILAAGTLLLAAVILLPGLRHHKAFAQQQQAFTGGTYSFSAQWVTSDPTVPAAAFIGVINLDGSGNATAGVTEVFSASPEVQTGNAQLAGTYVINPDGTGTVSLQSSDGSIATTIAIALTDGGNGFYLAVTSGTNGVVETGTARRQ
jgi:hypothetical protein